MQDAIQAAGTRLLYLPSYSPDFNAIEQAAASLKALLRSTIPDLWAAIRQAFTRFTPQECRNYVAAAGYEEDLAVTT